MAGTMRRMGIYLGLVEDDDARGYGRYDARQADHPDADRRYDRYEDSRYGAEDYAEDGYVGEPYGRAGEQHRRAGEQHRRAGERYGRAEDAYAGGYADEELEAEEPPPGREPDPVSLRRSAGARPLGLASATPSAGSSRLGATLGASSGSGAAGLAVRESVVRESAVRETAAREAAVREPVVEPEPAPAVKEPYRITTVHPRTYNEARQIGERFREGGAVIMNLTELDDADAKRLVDFAAGLIFGLRGSIERVTAKVFLLSPRDVDVTAEDKARIREGGFVARS